MKFYVFQEVVSSPLLPQICQYLVKIKLASVKTVDLQSKVTKHNGMIRLTFVKVKQLPFCLWDTSLLQCHLQEVSSREIPYVFVYIGIMLIGFRWASKDALWAYYLTVNWFAGISVSCVTSLGGWIYDYLWPSCIVTALHSPWMQTRVSSFM